MGWIYNATNKINGKGYVGQTIRPIKERLEEHQSGKSKSCRAFHGAIKKYGWKNFDIDCYECLDEELNKHEKWMVNLMGTLSPDGYNLKEGGGSRGKDSDETKQKKQKAQLGKTHTDEARQKNREAHLGEKNHFYGKTHSEESNQKNREAHLGENSHMYGKTGEKHHFYGEKHTDETKEKQRRAKLGKNNRNSRRVYRYDLDGVFIDSFESCGEAGRHLKTTAGNIGACARGKLKKSYNFKWSYELDIFI